MTAKTSDWASQAGDVVEDRSSVGWGFDEEGDRLGADVEVEVEERAAALLGLGAPDERGDAGQVVSWYQADPSGFGTLDADHELGEGQVLAVEVGIDLLGFQTPSDRDDLPGPDLARRPARVSRRTPTR